MYGAAAVAQERTLILVKPDAFQRGLVTGMVADAVKEARTR